MATSLIDSMTEDFEPDEYHDSYREALQELVEAKVEGRDVTPAPSPPRRSRPACWTRSRPAWTRPAKKRPAPAKRRRQGRRRPVPRRTSANPDILRNENRPSNLTQPGIHDLGGC